MHVILSVAHPAHVHLMRNLYFELTGSGIECTVVAKEKEFATELLDIYRIPYKLFGGEQKSTAGRMLALLGADIRLLSYMKSKRCDLTVSVNTPYVVQASRIANVPSIYLTDTESATAINRLAFPFADSIMIPSCFRGAVPSSKEQRYESYHELAYLHPDRFTPDKAQVEECGINPSEDYIIMRISSKDASHDFNESGLKLFEPKETLEFIRELERFGRVYVTSELPMEGALKGYALNVPLEKAHHVMAYARGYIGEGATMASECGCLGVPWVFAYRLGLGYLIEQQDKYGLGRIVHDPKTAIHEFETLLKNREAVKEGHTRLLRDKCDLTSLLVKKVREHLK